MEIEKTHPNPVPENRKYMVLKLKEEGNTYEAIANHLNLTRGAVAGIIHRARLWRKK